MTFNINRHNAVEVSISISIQISAFIGHQEDERSSDTSYPEIGVDIVLLRACSPLAPLRVAVAKKADLSSGSVP